VDYALSRFSTDNLSCMIVRFNKTALMDSFNQLVPAIGVEGDTETGPNKLSEVEKIVGDAIKKVEAGGDGLGISGSNSGRGHDPVHLGGIGGDGTEDTKRGNMEKVVEEEPSLTEGDSAKV
jgi:protein phosphatase PTC1